ncbi:uncharacterized protein FIBRA_08696 [Fibroporia radiculosa]|uniref:DUF6534 domain-containing protein n=1 Tax=Fibroporia radiculosa TaxID=599839 RepID=J4GX99_9APHY|nr:uncharacterized protein FIBRA_08696 [Fibroporia radiculosa]CCM06435.1 predicted protein [Fibroporia radiculosa]
MSVMNVADTFGAELIGTFIAAILFGITILQTFIYVQNHPGDAKWSKIIACVLCSLDAIQLAFQFHVIYWNLFLNSSMQSPTVVVWSYKAQLVIGSLCIMFVQTLYAHRIWKLDGLLHSDSRFRHVLPLFVTGFVLAGYGGGSASLYGGTDVIIAISMCFLLARSRTGFQTQSDLTIGLLMVFILNTGVLTSVLALLTMITEAVWPRGLVFAAVQYQMTELHINSFLALLNARRFLRRRRKAHIQFHQGNGLSSVGASLPCFISYSPKSLPTDGSIVVATVHDSDLGSPIEVHIARSLSAHQTHPEDSIGLAQ